MRLLLLILLSGACKHSVERSPPPTPAAAPGPTTKPSTELFAVPAEVAAKVTLNRVASGLARPVLVTFAPNDPRKRLFVVEQRGAIRVIENGAVAAKKFFTIGQALGR